jgi:hypothetical protein
VKRRIADWVLVQVVVMLAGVVLLLLPPGPAAAGALRGLGRELGTALFTVGAVALVYELKGRVQMLRDFRRMLDEYLGQQSVEAAGVTHIASSFGELPLLFVRGEFAPKLSLAGMDLRRFRTAWEAEWMQAVREGSCNEVRVLLQDPASEFAAAMRRVQGDAHLESVRTGQAQLIEFLARMAATRPDGRKVVQVKRSSCPVLAGLTICAGDRPGFRPHARYSPYFALPSTDAVPTLDVAGPDSPLFCVLERHFDNLWSRATQVDLPEV